MRLWLRCFTFFASLLFLANSDISAQNLGKTVTIQAKKQKLKDVLSLLEEQGKFKFSYNSNILPLDSLVDFDSKNLNVKESLNLLLKNQYEYRETPNFVIIRYAPLEMTMVVQESNGSQEQYLIRGKIVDKQNGKPIANASVYEKNLLQSTLSDKDGLFSLKLKNVHATITLTVSKEGYKDNSSYFLPEVVIFKDPKKSNGSYTDDELPQVENTLLGRTFITKKQRTQTRNIGGFIANAPAQISIGPGLGTHGSLSGQVVNRFSINVTGDYNAGVNGTEIGLLFNIDKKDARYFQFGGAFNLVGGSFTGLQISGFHNDVLQNFKGLQVSVGYNHVLGQFNGWQIGGLFNQVYSDIKGIQVSVGYNENKQSMRGLQIGGVFNLVKGNYNGLQIGSGYNLTGQQLSGVQAGAINQAQMVKGLQIGPGYNRAGQQLAGVQIGAINSARNVKGLQIGFFNFADTSAGYSIGLLNIIRKGYHKLSIGTNESIDLNVALKTGTPKFYTQLLYGQNMRPTYKLIALGFGLGKEIALGKQFSLNPELSTSYLYQGDWTYANLLNRADLNLNYQINSWLAISAGPAFNVYYSKQLVPFEGYEFLKPPATGHKLRSWAGWNFGVTLF
ncbi:carboxypeptidase-like regulatory domain-containing protein [Pedobacter sp. KR3-3]|uniref:Carboxypeptidase-like regulatory domain-containing protein n=1 Tax=Pedobacter albus TaxID=3113905 RepID=A0ABU7I679_9SPHI|nr:carboxypeptidase-like regulatory domain-containing protein [Pedobacter sp. KR3-3]MEE1944754.1 carboxypeptidase-like regulatory domain-containing protein [Pedobacter sp. KR3-3]